MKRRNLSLLLIVGATMVASVRYVGLFANSEGWRIEGLLWQWLVAVSGLGMSFLEGIATWYMWQSWSKAPNSQDRNTLARVMVASSVALLVMVAPYIQASSGKKVVSDVLSDGAMWVWSVANALAPILVMVGIGMAEKLAATDAQQAHREAGEAEQVLGAMLANFEAKINATMSNYVTVSDAQMAFDRLHQAKAAAPETQPVETVTESEPQPAPQLVSGETWQAKAVALAREQTESGAKPNYTHIAAAVGKTRTAVAAVVKAQLS